METIKRVTFTVWQFGFAGATALAIPSYLMGVAYLTSVKSTFRFKKIDASAVEVMADNSLSGLKSQLFSQASLQNSVSKSTDGRFLPLSQAKSFDLAKRQAKELYLGRFKSSQVARTIRKAKDIGLSESAYSIFLQKYVSKRLPAPFTNIAPLIAEAIEFEAESRNLDPFLLLAVIQTESSFRPQIQGLAGEIGLMQLMPKTAEWLAKKNGIPFLGEASLKNPVENVRLGAVYISHLRDRFQANGQLYLTAYNMGSTKLKRKIASLNEQDKLPEIYAKKILKNYQNLYNEFEQIAVASFAAAKRPLVLSSLD